MATSRTGLFGNDSNVNPGYDQGPATGSGTSGSTDGKDLAIVLAKLQQGIIIGTSTTDEYKSVLIAAQTITLGNAGVAPADLGYQALLLAYNQGNITDDTFLAVAPLGTSLPASADSVVYGPWETLGTALGAVVVANAGSPTRGSIVQLGSKDFKIPKRKGVTVCVEYRLNRSSDVAITPPGIAATSVRFEPDWSVIETAAVSDNKYRITIGGQAFQESQAAAAAIPAGTFQYRYVLKITNPESPSVPSTYAV